MKRRLPVAVALLLGACAVNPSVSPGPAVPDNSTVQQPNPSPPSIGGEVTAGDVQNTFEHFLDERDPFDILAQKQEEGSPLIATRLHSCQKMSYAALGQLLSSRGVDLAAKSMKGEPPTAGELYAAGAQALGAPNYAARTREPIQITTAGATKLMDVFVQAATEIIANLPNVQACQSNGQPSRMFADDGTCTVEGISCLIGAPATQQQIALCNQAIGEASTSEIGQRIAVAAILAAAHTCE